MRRDGVGPGAIRARFSALKAACSWGVSRRMVRIGRQRHGVGDVILRERTKTGKSRQVTLDAGTLRLIEAWRREADEIAGAEVPPSPRWLYNVFAHEANMTVALAIGSLIERTPRSC